MCSLTTSALLLLRNVFPYLTTSAHVLTIWVMRPHLSSTLITLMIATIVLTFEP